MQNSINKSKLMNQNLSKNKQVISDIRFILQKSKSRNQKYQYENQYQ